MLSAPVTWMKPWNPLLWVLTTVGEPLMIALSEFIISTYPDAQSSKTDGWHHRKRWPSAHGFLTLINYQLPTIPGLSGMYLTAHLPHAAIATSRSFTKQPESKKNHKKTTRIALLAVGSNTSNDSCLRVSTYQNKFRLLLMLTGVERSIDARAQYPENECACLSADRCTPSG